MLYSPRYQVLRQELVHARINAGMTQVTFAKKMGRAQSYVSKIETGERYVDVLDFLEWCQITGVDCCQVLSKLVAVDPSATAVTPRESD